jgi:hypothetical protein
MDLSEKLEKLRAITGETDESVLEVYLDIAGDVILRRLYPYGTEITQVPSPYEVRQIEIASYLLNKRGAEGETAHSENGINRTYGDAYVPPSYLRGIVPFARVPHEDDEA